MRCWRMNSYQGHHWAVSWVAPPTPARLRATSHWVIRMAGLPLAHRKEPPKDAGGDVEGDVADQGVCRRRWSVPKDVTFGDAHVRPDSAP